LSLATESQTNTINFKVSETVLKNSSKKAYTSVPGVKVITAGFNSRDDSESEMSYTHGSNLQWFRSYEFLKYNK